MRKVGSSNGNVANSIDTVNSKPSNSAVVCSTVLDENNEPRDKYQYKGNTYEVDGYIVTGTDSRGNKFKFSIEDFDRVKEHTWIKRTDNRYFITAGKGKHVFLHRFILNARKGEIVDHKDMDEANNTRNNLRIVNRAINSLNSKLFKNNTSGARGVYQNRHGKPWRAELTIMAKRLLLGKFDTIEEAIEARKAAEIRYYGEYFSDPAKHVG